MLHNFDVITDLSVMTAIRDQKFLQCKNGYYNGVLIKTIIRTSLRVAVVAAFVGLVAGNIALAFSPAVKFVVLLIPLSIMVSAAYTKLRKSKLAGEEYFFISVGIKYTIRLAEIRNREDPTFSSQLSRFLDL